MQTRDQLIEFETILDTKVSLSSEQKAIIKARYIGLVREAEASHWRASLAHHIFGNSIMIAGVVLAALIPVAEFIGDGGSSARNVIFWINWALALGIAIVNGFMRLFNVSKKYVLGMTSLEKMRAEGWMFLEEIGRYSKRPDDNFRLFCSRIEKIKDGVVGKTADNAVAQRGSDIEDTDVLPTWRDDRRDIGRNDDRYGGNMTARQPARSVRVMRPPPASKKLTTTPVTPARSDDDDNVVVDV